MVVLLWGLLLLVLTVEEEEEKEEEEEDQTVVTLLLMILFCVPAMFVANLASLWTWTTWCRTQFLSMLHRFVRVRGLTVDRVAAYI